MVQTMSNTSLAIDSPHGRKLFVFDRVFDSDVMQEGIWEYVSDSVGAFMQGYNVSVLAYGQSGAGKSYTMGTSGPDEQHDSDLMGKSFVVFESFVLTVQVLSHELPLRFSRNSTPPEVLLPRRTGLPCRIFDLGEDTHSRMRLVIEIGP